MNFPHTPRPKSSKDPSRLLILCVLFSLLFHVAMFILLPLLQQQEKLQTSQQQPTIVRLVDLPTESEKPQVKKPQTKKPREFEIDPVPAKPQPEVPVESFRQADRDQKVDREQAPKGDDVRDQTTQETPPALPPRKLQKPQEQTVQQQPQKFEQEKPQAVKEKSKTKKTVTPSPPTNSFQPQQLPPPQIQLSPEQLRPNASTLDRIARGSQADRNRVKERKDLAIGDEVWINLQHNLLVSFFRRFHDKIELVWNYPVKAAMNGIEGTLEIMIIVNPKGELLDAYPIESSGSELLDYEAIQAIYRAAPFGPLSKHYPHETLKIHAYFSYRLSGQAIYGR